MIAVPIITLGVVIAVLALAIAAKVLRVLRAFSGPVPRKPAARDGAAR
jgi:hypothetical protein